jgi:hypothetical protein
MLDTHATVTPEFLRKVLSLSSNLLKYVKNAGACVLKWHKNCRDMAFDLENTSFSIIYLLSSHPHPAQLNGIAFVTHCVAIPGGTHDRKFSSRLAAMFVAHKF